MPSRWMTSKVTAVPASTTRTLCGGDADRPNSAHPAAAAASRSAPSVSGVSYASSNGSGMDGWTKVTEAPVRAVSASVTAPAVAGTTEARPTCSMGASGRWGASASRQAAAAEDSLTSVGPSDTENTRTSSSPSKHPPFMALLPTSRVRSICVLCVGLCIGGRLGVYGPGGAIGHCFRRSRRTPFRAVGATHRLETGSGFSVSRPVLIRVYPAIWVALELQNRVPWCKMECRRT
jgi:hypothetical protein